MSKIYLLNSDKFENIMNLPVIKINFFNKVVNLDLYDAIIFTSKNAIRAINAINQEWKNRDIYSIGQGTSKEIKLHNATPIYTAKNSYGDSFAQEISKSLRGKKILFLRAKKVTSNLNTTLKDLGIDLDEIVVYETVCQRYNNHKKPEKDSVIIFTSPSTVNCFFKNFTWDESYKAVVIGKVTAKAMPDDIDIFYAKEQTLKSCVQTANSLIAV
ncbi:MAG: uroporphyrinogen-III synthase [Epsilonproteobacteria bacterium]|nr:uroporphyrinogen-III synthase [Campylobacterota bacterium]